MALKVIIDKGSASSVPFHEKEKKESKFTKETEFGSWFVLWIMIVVEIWFWLMRMKLMVGPLLMLMKKAPNNFLECGV